MCVVEAPSARRAHGGAAAAAAARGGGGARAHGAADAHGAVMHSMVALCGAALVRNKVQASQQARERSARKV